MAKEIIILDIDEVGDIALIDSGNPYTTGKRKEEGKTFSRFRYNGVVFTVSDDTDFLAAHRNDDVGRVKLIAGTRMVEVTDEDGTVVEVEKPTLEYESFNTLGRLTKIQQHKTKMELLKAISLKDTDLTEEGMKSLLGAAVI